MGDRRPSFDDPRPHQDRPLVTAGAPRDAAEAAVVLLHGRGATAEGIVATAEEFYRHGVALLAPQAARQTWFPASASAPVDRNEPWLSSAVAATRNAVETAGAVGVDPARTVVFGFSQGGSVAAEFAVRHPRRYGGLVVASGALPGAPGPTGDHGVTGSLDGTAVAVTCGADDADVDHDAVRHTADVLEAAGGDVTEAIAPGVGHTITDDAIAAAAAQLDAILA